MKEYELNRKKYQEIRKMDHQEMQAYINAVYRNGVAAGKREATEPAFNTLQALEEISKIKGIGLVKLEQIKLAMIAAGAKVPEKPVKAPEE